MGESEFEWEDFLDFPEEVIKRVVPEASEEVIQRALNEAQRLGTLSVPSNLLNLAEEGANEEELVQAMLPRLPVPDPELARETLKTLQRAGHKWVTTNSVEVNWTPHYVNWVRAAKYILYVFPKKHPTRNIDYVAACHEVYNVWAGSDTALIDELKRTDVDSLPLFGQVNWSKDGSVSEGTFYDWVKSGWQWGWRYACDWQPWKESELMKAAVRIAYWVASWVPYPKKREWWYYGYRNHWGGGPQCILRDPDNWEFNGGHGWNCCDHAALAVALMRAAGIPARPVLGGPNGNDHVWVEVLNVDGKWVPVGPTGGAGAWYCRPWWRQGWISNHDYEHGVQHYAISISDLEDAWKRYTCSVNSHHLLVATVLLEILFLVTRRNTL